MLHLRNHVTYANVVATLALALAAGGVSYAAVTLPRNSVGRIQIRNRAVTPSKLAFPIGVGSAVQHEPATVGRPPFTCPLNEECTRSGGERAPVPLAQLSLHLSARSYVLVVGSVDVSAEGASDERQVALIASPPGDESQWEHSPNKATLNSADGYQAHVALSEGMTLAAGTHRITLSAFGGESAGTPQETASHGELIVIALPFADAHEMQQP